MKLQELRWPEVEQYLVKKDQILIPIGSVEQHGPTGLIGTDYLTALGIAEQVSHKLEIIVAPPICYGMSSHHMAFPGTITLSPSTLVSVVIDIVESLSQHGFKRFYFINGHGGNIAPINTAFCEIKVSENDLFLQLINWWYLEAVKKYEEKEFGEENGQHATIGEISVTMNLLPKAFEKVQASSFSVTKINTHWPLSPSEFRKKFPDGRMGSNPQKASKNHGIEIQNRAVSSICQAIIENNFRI